jgi:hypothetical protein
MLGNHTDISVGSSSAGLCNKMSPKFDHIFAAILGYWNIFETHRAMFPCGFDVMEADISTDCIRN